MSLALGMALSIGRIAYYGLIVFILLGGIAVLICSFIPGEKLRYWRRWTTTALGAFGISYAGLSIYGILHNKLRHSLCTPGTLFVAKVLLIVAALVVLVLISREEAERARKKRSETAVGPGAGGA